MPHAKISVDPLRIDSVIYVYVTSIHTITLDIKQTQAKSHNTKHVPERNSALAMSVSVPLPAARHVLTSPATQHQQAGQTLNYIVGSKHV